jgi:hypothetical protein
MSLSDADGDIDAHPAGSIFDALPTPPVTPKPPPPQQDQTEIISILKQRLHDSLRDAARARKHAQQLEQKNDTAWDQITKLQTYLTTTTSKLAKNNNRKRKHLSTPDPNDMISITACLLDDKDISLTKYKLMANLFRNLPRHLDIQSYRRSLNAKIKERLRFNKFDRPDTPGIWVSPHGVVEMMMEDHPLPDDHTGPYEVLLAFDGATLSRSTGHVSLLLYYTTLALSFTLSSVSLTYTDSLTQSSHLNSSQYTLA